MTFRARMLARFVVAILSWFSPWLSPCSPKLLHGVFCFHRAVLSCSGLPLVIPHHPYLVSSCFIGLYATRIASEGVDEVSLLVLMGQPQ